MKNLVVFDMDGTILDTLEDLKDAVNYGLRVNGFKERSYEEVKWMVGRGMPRLIHAALPENHSDEDYEKVYKDFLNYYGLHSSDKTVPYEGIKEAALEIKKSGFVITVNSNKNDKDAGFLAEQFFPGVFDFVLGSRPGMEKKPAPDGVNFILQKFGFTKEETIFIGDSDVDYQTAVNAGVRFVGCDWGFRGRKFLEEHGVKIIADNPRELPKLINSLH